MAVSIRDVARRAGVSVGTVSNVLNRPDTVAPATVARVQRAIEDLGYVRNEAARRLRAGRSSSVGFIVLDVRNPFFTDLARGAEDEAMRRGLMILLGNSDEDIAREATYLDLFEEQRVHGLLISPYGDVAERLTRLRERGIPAVLVDRRSPDESFSSVAVDDVAGGRMAAQHLVDIGRRRIAFVGGPRQIRQVSDRLEGARQIVEGTPGATLEEIPTAALTVIEGRKVGDQIMSRPADERPDAIFAANDLVATGILQAVVMRDARAVPEQIAIIGFDDIDFASASVVPLSSVRQPAQLMGRTALQILVEEAADPSLEPRHVTFQPELVVRASTQQS